MKKKKTGKKQVKSFTFLTVPAFEVWNKKQNNKDTKK